MSLKTVHWVLRIITLLSFVGLIFIFIKISPYENQNSNFKIIPNIISFFAIFFIFCFSIFSLFFFWVKRKATERGEKNIRNKTIQNLLNISVRQGFLLALGIGIILGLQAFKVLTWWDGMLAFGLILMMELYFLSK